MPHVDEGKHSMDFELSKEHHELQAKAKAFVEQVLVPHEMEVEVNDGLSPETHDKIAEQVLAWGFNASNHAVEDGGPGWTIFEQTLLHEQLGRATGATRTRPPSSCTARRWRVASSTGPYRSSGAGATCASPRWSGSTAMSASSASGRARPRSSA